MTGRRQFVRASEIPPIAKLSVHVAAIAKRLSAIGLLALATTIAAEYRVTIAQLLGRERYLGPAHARHAFVYALRHHSERTFSLHEIARLLDIDHKTVEYAIDAHARRLENPRWRFRPLASCQSSSPVEPARCAS